MPRNVRQKLYKVNIRSLRRIDHPDILLAYIEVSSRVAVNRAKKGLPFTNVPDNYGFSMRNSKNSRIVFIHNVYNQYQAGNYNYRLQHFINANFYLNALTKQARFPHEIPYATLEETQEVIQQFNADFRANLQPLSGHDLPQDPFSNQPSPVSSYSENTASNYSFYDASTIRDDEAESKEYSQPSEYVPTYAFNSSSDESVPSTNSSGPSLNSELAQALDDEVKQINHTQDGFPVDEFEDVFRLPKSFTCRLSPTFSELQAATEDREEKLNQYLALSPISFSKMILDEMESQSVPPLPLLRGASAGDLTLTSENPDSVPDFQLELPTSPPRLTSQISWPNFFPLQRFNSQSSEVSKQEQTYEDGVKRHRLDLGG